MESTFRSADPSAFDTINHFRPWYAGRGAAVSEQAEVKSCVAFCLSNEKHV